MPVYNLNFRVFDDSSRRASSRKLHWSTVNPFMVLHSAEKRDNYLKIYLDDILSVRVSEEFPESLEIIFYPLINSKRERQRGYIFGDGLPDFEAELKIRLKPPIPRELLD